MQYRQVTTRAGRGFQADQFKESVRGIGLDRTDRLYVVGDSEVKLLDVAGRMLRR
jgi:hypothetical protein